MNKYKNIATAVAMGVITFLCGVTTVCSLQGCDTAWAAASRTIPAESAPQIAQSEECEQVGIEEGAWNEMITSIEDYLSGTDAPKCAPQTMEQR
jgi:hypothetical protein